MFDRVLVPTDGSEAAELAVPYAVELAEQFDATLYPMYVVDTDALSHALGSEQVDRIDAGQFGEMRELHERAAAAIDRVREYTTAALEVEPVIEAGVPHEVITTFAEDTDIDLIVMTSQGRGGVKRALLGSVTERVARGTSVPVLVVDSGDDSQPLVEPDPDPA
ncbi:universal stress protein [Natronorubrum bangense]|uniref:UspA domain protein n=2 Tax=Natronorubrum bangense TaxID=61858 RepID=L9WEM1_9EURY|nr:universal stress protein [Natronorubrum bangense]ELY47802.1 UspA domain protein [Natronorubrum bangense JCM 10635]QCC53717.1 universal stress protein [Natronorubrum bangense]